MQPVSSPFSFLSRDVPQSLILHPPTLWLLIEASLPSASERKHHQMSFHLREHHPAPIYLPCMPFSPYLSSLWEFSVSPWHVTHLYPLSRPQACQTSTPPLPPCVCLTDRPLNSFLLCFHDPASSTTPSSATHTPEHPSPFCHHHCPTSSLDSPAPGYHPPLSIKAWKVLPNLSP